MGRLIGTYLFGSFARGDTDQRSDLDVLAVVENNQGRVPVNEVTRTLPDQIASVQPTITWYGRTRLEQMFSDGELFCWHLHLEAKALSGPPIASLFPTLSKYVRAEADVAFFLRVLQATPKQLEVSPANSIYECGVAYVCVRNIAMAASWHLLPSPDFSRYSPFRLPAPLKLPISVEEYETSMACRMAGQRGHATPTNVGIEFALEYAASAIEWARHVASYLGEKYASQTC
jgi:hypothetical protein